MAMIYQDIIKLVKKGDSRGFEELYLAYGTKFYDYSIKRWHLSEDESWEIVYKALETLVLKLSNYEFESKEHFENFLFKVFINFLRQDFRAKRNQAETTIKFVDLNNEGDLSQFINSQIDDNSFSEYYKTEQIENPTLIALNEALNGLEAFDKDILLLRAQNYSYEEIATMLGIDNNQLKVKHHRAKQKLLLILNKNIK